MSLEQEKFIYSLDELVEMDVKEIPFLLDNIIPTNCVGMITGPSDTNKSTFLRQLSFAIISGHEEFLGLKLNTKYRKVLFLSTEDSSVSTAVLVQKQMANEIPKEVRSNMIFAFGATTINKVKSLLNEHKVDLIVLDTWTDNFNGNINDSVSVRSSLKAFGELVNIYDCTVLGIHHSKKYTEGSVGNKGQMLGSQGIEAYCRVVIDIRRESDVNRVISIVKGNYTPEEFKKKPIRVRLNTDIMQLERLEESSYGFDNINRTFEDDLKEEFLERILTFKKQNYSLDKTVSKLKEEYPDKRIPKRGTIRNWVIEELKSSIHPVPKELIE